LFWQLKPKFDYRTALDALILYLRFRYNPKQNLHSLTAFVTFCIEKSFWLKDRQQQLLLIARNTIR